jgi:uncharacterized protein
VKRVVFDTGVFVSGVFWRHEAHLCLNAWLRGLVTPVVSPEIHDEYERVLSEVRSEQNFSTDLSPWLALVRNRALWVSPVQLTHPVCRDSSDDKFIEAALTGDATTVIARDRDLTTLQKPFGVAIVTPRQWLAGLSRAERRLLG